MKPLHSNSMALEIAFDDKKYRTNTSFLHEPMKQNSACVLLTKEFFYNEHIKNMGIVLSSADFLDFKVSYLAAFSEVWIDVLLFHSVLYCVCPASPSDFHSVVKELCNS